MSRGIAEGHVIPLRGDTVPDATRIGGKARSIAQMMALGLPVPPAFVITTEAYRDYARSGELDPVLVDDIRRAVRHLEEETGKRLGAGPRPLLVSVRSGAAISMPGMMDTVLNLGITPQTEFELAAESGDPRFARNVHRRFVELYSSIVLRTTGLAFSDDETREQWDARVLKACGRPVPVSAEECLLEAVRAVFDSWNTRRARRYRAHHGISDDLGTAVTVQAMVFGNLGADSGTGVLFTRNPLTGEKRVYGEYLPDAQGEDVVSGSATPRQISALGETLPDVHATLLGAAETLERHGRDMQDIEFTVERARLYLLQCRAGKRAAAAAARIAVEMVREGLIDERTALRRVSPQQARALVAPRLGPGAADSAHVIATGEAASPGVGAGKIVLCADEAERLATKGEEVVLLRPTTSPEDIHGMIAARAVVTEKGGSTSHAAVVSRSIGVPCTVGIGEGASARLEAREVTVDGGSGQVFDGRLATVAPSEHDDDIISALSNWARAHSPVAVLDPDEADLEMVVDLSAEEQQGDQDSLEAMFSGRTHVMGGPLGTDEGVHAAVRSGVKVIVGRPALAILLAAVQTPPADDME